MASGDILSAGHQSGPITGAFSGRRDLDPFLAGVDLVAVGSGVRAVLDPARAGVTPRVGRGPAARLRAAE